MKPNFFIIGAMKSATTSLHSYLLGHPDVAMSEPKEINYFSNSHFWKKGVRWYEKHFQTPARIRGESSTSYTAFPITPHVPRRMSEYAPDARLVYLVRDPISRLVSHYVHNRGIDTENRPFSEIVEEILSGRLNQYVYQSSYYFQISQYLDFFDASQILIVTTEMLKTDPNETLRRVCGHLHIDPSKLHADATVKHNDSKTMRMERTFWVNLVYPGWMDRHPRMPWKLKSPFFHLAKLFAKPVARPKLSDDEIEQLIPVFREDVKQLQAFTGNPFIEWRNYSNCVTAAAH